MSQVYVIILAGGNGERLWPLSTPEHPKQLLPLVGDKTLLDLALDRAVCLTDVANILVVTCAQQETMIRLAVGNRGQILVEPEQKNTAPAILYACQRIAAYDQQAMVVIMPADHFIDDNQLFTEHIGKATRIAKRHQRIVLLGIQPTRPVTGYGYIQYYTEAGADVSLVTQFHEKPRLEVAKSYLQRTDMLWNSGIVIGKVQIVLEQFMVCAELLYDEMQGYLQGRFDYSSLPSISFDYAVLEKTRELLVVPATFSWSDVGDIRTFLSIKDLAVRAHSNLLQIHAENNLVQVSPDIMVVCVGVNNLCIVEEAGILMIVSNDSIGATKEAHAAYALQQSGGERRQELTMPPQYATDSSAMKDSKDALR